MKTVLTDMLNIEHPIMLAGMAGVSYAELVAGVSNAGGYGVLGAGAMELDEMTDQIKKIRTLTDKPFGVDLLTARNPNPIDEAKAIIDGGASSFVAGLGVPRAVVDLCHEAGLLVISMAGKVKHAQLAEEAGCDIVVAQGTEAGGHTGAVGGIALMPQIVDAVKIPVVGAGGIFDGRGLVACCALGCVGVWVGTRFIASTEAHAANAYKNAILEATESDTVISRCWTGKPLRAIRNRTTDDWESRPGEIQKFPIQAMVMTQEGAMGFVRADVAEYDPDQSCLPAGQGCGAIGELKSCKEIIDEMIASAEALLAAGLVPKRRRTAKT